MLWNPVQSFVFKLSTNNLQMVISIDDGWLSTIGAPKGSAVRLVGVMAVTNADAKLSFAVKRPSSNGHPKVAKLGPNQAAVPMSARVSVCGGGGRICTPKGFQISPYSVWGSEELELGDQLHIDGEVETNSGERILVIQIQTRSQYAEDLVVGLGQNARPASYVAEPATLLSQIRSNCNRTANEASKILQEVSQ